MLTELKIEQLLWSDYNHQDRDRETISFLGGCMQINGIQFNSISMGFMVLSEIYNINLSFPEGDIENVLLALYILKFGKKAIKNNLKKFKQFTKKLENIDIENVASELRLQLKYSTAGFNLLEQENSKKELIEKRIYDSVWLSDMLVIIQPILQKNTDEIIWSIPLTQIGFYIASYAKKEGVKNVKRKPNIKALRDYQKSLKEKNKSKDK